MINPVPSPALHLAIDFFGSFHLQNFYVLDMLPPPDPTIILILVLKCNISLFLRLGEFPSVIFKLQNRQD